MRPLRLLILAAVLAPTARAEAQGGLPINLQLGLPQGEFQENVAVAGGFGIAGIFPLASEFGLRLGLDVQIYGSETRRQRIDGGLLGPIDVDVTTTNAIVGGSFGAQLGLPSGTRPKPYIGGMIGFSNFNTHSSATSEDTTEPFASRTNLSDNTLSKHAFGGMYFPVANGAVLVDLGARYTWNGESVRYLTQDGITEVGGDIVIAPNESRADLLTITLGVAIRFGGKH
jgi:hypothetical protein